MAVRISLNYNPNTCKLTAEVWDPLDRGLDGTIQILFSSSQQNFSENVTNLTATRQVFDFDPDRTGLVHQIAGVLDVGEDADTDKMIVALCS